MREEPITAPCGEGARARGVLPIEAENLLVDRGGRRLLAIGELALDGGLLTVVLGPNGAGKSLLLRVLAGLLSPDRGRVRWAGAPPVQGRARARRLGFVFQKPVLLRRSALANVRYALRVAGFGLGEARVRAEAALERASLAALARAPARVLSAGEQQRLALARALALEPEVLLLDEPAASLDPASTLAIEALVGEAQAQGTKVVLVTHDLAQARRLGEEIVFLHAGGVSERGPADRFFAGPESEPARAYFEGRLIVQPREELS